MLYCHSCSANSAYQVSQSEHSLRVLVEWCFQWLATWFCYPSDSQSFEATHRRPSSPGSWFTRSCYFASQWVGRLLIFSHQFQHFVRFEFEVPWWLLGVVEPSLCIFGSNLQGRGGAPRLRSSIIRSYSIQPPFRHSLHWFPDWIIRVPHYNLPK